MDDIVCYCFEFKESNILDDFKKNGHSTILEKIIEEKKLGGCQCAAKNPKGR